MVKTAFLLTCFLLLLFAEKGHLKKHRKAQNRNYDGYARQAIDYLNRQAGNAEFQFESVLPGGYSGYQNGRPFTQLTIQVISRYSHPAVQTVRETLVVRIFISNYVVTHAVIVRRDSSTSSSGYNPCPPNPCNGPGWQLPCPEPSYPCPSPGWPPWPAPGPPSWPAPGPPSWPAPWPEEPWYPGPWPPAWPPYPNPTEPPWPEPPPDPWPTPPPEPPSWPSGPIATITPDPLPGIPPSPPIRPVPTPPPDYWEWRREERPSVLFKKIHHH